MRDRLLPVGCGAGRLSPWSAGTTPERLDRVVVSEPDQQPLCSAKGCPDLAVWGLEWNNPKVHTPERRKVWLACDEHRASLSDFLSARSFLKDVKPVAEAEPR